MALLLEIGITCNSDISVPDKINGNTLPNIVNLACCFKEIIAESMKLFQFP